MVETFVSKCGRIRVQLYERQDRAAAPIPPAPLQKASQTITARIESAEITFPESVGGISVEMTLEEFSEFFFQTVFPRAANRLNRIKRQNPKK